MEIVFLGTSAAVPARRRSTSGIAVRSGAGVVLLDCGEGTQRSLMASNVSFMKVGAVLVTHMHGDHVFGLPPLLQTMGLSDRREPLEIYGPSGLAEYVESSLRMTGGGGTPFPAEVVELEGGESFRAAGFDVECFQTDHGIASIGYVLREPPSPGRLDRDRAAALGAEGSDFARLKAGESVKGIDPRDVVGDARPGLSVAYTGDTRPSAEVAGAVRGVDVLIHEATYMEADAESAEQHGHSTAAQAAGVARDAGVRHLILTHVSNRYEDRDAVAEEARGVFPSSDVADDLFVFTVTRSGVRVERPDVGSA